MIALLIVTLIWAFSFGIIGSLLQGVDPAFVASVRLGIAFLCLLPFLRTRRFGTIQQMELLAIGGLQFGVMYLCYLSAFRFIDAYLVALFSVFTPIWVTVVDGLLKRQAKGRAILAALLATFGALILRYGGPPESDFLTGFLLMQVANLAFGGGQIWFREWKRRHPQTSEKEVFALPLLGGMILSVAAYGVSSQWGPAFSLPTPNQWMVLLYLGAIASGLGFFLWNYGASRVSTGFLAAANNLVVPLGIAFALMIGKRSMDGDDSMDWVTFAIGTLLIGVALIVGRKRSQKANLPTNSGPAERECR